MRIRLKYTVLVACLFMLAFAGCKSSAPKDDKQQKEKDQGPIYMRPIHHSKDTANV